MQCHPMSPISFQPQPQPRSRPQLQILLSNNPILNLTIHICYGIIPLSYFELCKFKMIQISELKSQKPRSELYTSADFPYTKRIEYLSFRWSHFNMHTLYWYWLKYVFKFEIVVPTTRYYINTFLIYYI